MRAPSADHEADLDRTLHFSALGVVRRLILACCIDQADFTHREITKRPDKLSFCSATSTGNTKFASKSLSPLDIILISELNWTGYAST